MVVLRAEQCIADLWLCRVFDRLLMINGLHMECFIAGVVDWIVCFFFAFPGCLPDRGIFL